LPPPPNEQQVRGEEANRNVAVNVLHEWLGHELDRCLWRVWMCASAFLLLSMFALLVWSQAYDGDESMDCSTAFARLIFLVAVLQGLQQSIFGYRLCFDEVIVPIGARLVRCMFLLGAVGWPVEAAVVFMQKPGCSRALKVATEVMVAYYALLTVLLLLAPSCVLSMIMCLLHRGVLRAPLRPPVAATPQAARTFAAEELLRQLPTIEFNVETFNDDGTPGSFPASCPVCLEAFSAATAIKQAPCGHIFHTECLGGWARVAQSCPLCRLELSVEPGMSSIGTTNA